MRLPNMRPQVFRRLHIELLRRVGATGELSAWTDETGGIECRNAVIAGQPLLVVTLAAPPHELLSDPELAGILGLTLRQTAVARLLALRLTTPEIAARLSIRETTVRRHIEHVFQRLQVASRREIAAAVRRRVLDSLSPARSWPAADSTHATSAPRRARSNRLYTTPAR